ncbi:hypothetical protein OEZ85_000687 [Tetradesmus obliquus]|uniref:Uncharacterized protein n=1 Tax=Tetradesmus obliquus TaxID=3088 RepID=A0ABY8UMH6_TETOB|nr:hypothetical protein OEZ85_000687 [Tetradesmus obliquus]
MSHEAQTRLPWTAEEDAILISLVERYGEKRWNMVANGLPGRTGKGCSHRWRTYLRPDVKHPHLEPFTEWEAAVIVQAQREMGNNWLAIAKLLLPGRSNTAVKNFWHCRLKSGSGTNANRFIVEGYGLRFLLAEVPHEERIHPVALPAFPSTAPTGQLHHPKSHHHHLQQQQQQQQQQQLQQHYQYEQPMLDFQMAGMTHMPADSMMVAAAAAADHQAMAAAAAAAQAYAEREAALFRRQGRVSGSILGAVGGELHKRPRVSLTLTSPRNGAGAKRHRVSYMGGLAVGRPSADGADVDDCLSFWKV